MELAKHLPIAEVKAALSAACTAYLAGDAGAWAQALVLQARLEALRADVGVAVGADKPLPTCQHPGCSTITLSSTRCWKHRNQVGE